MRLRDLLSSDDRGLELHLLLGAVVILGGLGLEVLVVIRGALFDITAFGQGMGFLFSGVGIAAVGQGLQRRAQGPS